MGWTLIWTSIPTTLLFLILKGGESNEDNEQPVGSIPRGQETTEENSKTSSHWSHSFMFIPVAFWPIILLGLGVFLIL